MIYEAKPYELRAELDVARKLANCHMGFVVMPATSAADFVNLLKQAAERLEQQAEWLEKERAP